MKNIHPIDRWCRLALAIVLAQGGYFWLTGVWQWAAFAGALLMVGTAGAQFCPLYRLLGMGTAQWAVSKVSPLWRWLGWLALLALLVGGSYGSALFSRKLFLEEFNAMNHFYKQTLFLTGKNERDSAVANGEKMVSGYAVFQRKYSAYQPYALRGDHQLVSDLQQVAVIMAAAQPLVRDGDLHQAHLDLEKIRPVFQGIFKRNGFSMLAVALVDFHDAMELILDAANAKDAEKVKQLHPMLSDKFKPVELEANDAEIQAIRKNLDELLALAQAGNLGAMPAQADQLKRSFVKVYLKRG
ncbi:DUF2892 domain-containing protein [Limnohabitans sp. DCL3]|uniref:YgaP family membrane protein n=1 Tax=Limnohabitans sp. DCL3 TaxID=3374103 RepID=UPI003A869690